MNEAPLYRRLSLNKHGFLDACWYGYFTLENFIACFITESGINVNQILVMTFTEKAAGEIKSQGFTTLFGLSRGKKSRQY